jgi:glycosyltransferase involved in cell wall biosynthesis
VERTVVVNATSIAGRADGIGAYGVHLLKALAQVDGEIRFQVYLNARARERFEGVAFPDRMRVEWVSGSMSPDHGTQGHLRRWLHANALALRHRDSLLFATSQIEAPLWGRPGIVTVHDVIPLLFPGDHPRQSHYYRRCLGPALRRAAAVITPSETTKRLLASIYGLRPEKIHVIAHGPTVPPRNGEPASWRGRPYVLCLAHASPTKNLGALVRAFALVQAHIGEDLVIAGTGLDGAGVGSLLRRLAVPASRVQLRPNVSDGEKLQLLDGASLFVYPSLDEGFGLPPLEAMARGCPVVTASSGSLSEVCADAPVYVDPRDVSGIARTLHAVLRDPERRQRLAQRGLARARAFSWESSVRRHLELFQLVLRRGRLAV